MKGHLLVKPVARRISDLSVKPGLLVSVRDVSEAEAAISGGADWIDLKEPSKGPLGSVDFVEAIEIVRKVARRRPLSAALGELFDLPSDLSHQMLRLPAVRYVKLGLAEMGTCSDWQGRWQSAEEAVAAAGKLLVPVVYADWRRANAPSPDNILALAENSHAGCLLIDTFDKEAEGTLLKWGESVLRMYIREAKRRRISVILAGKVKSEDLSNIPLAMIELIGVRGAVCRANRVSAVDRKLVTQFKRELVCSHQDESHRFV